MSSLTCAYYDITNDKDWVESTTDTLFTGSTQVDPDRFDITLKQSILRQSDQIHSTSSNSQPQLFNNTRRSSSALENGKSKPTKPTNRLAHDHHPLSTNKQDHHCTKRYSALQFDSSTNPCLDPTTLSAFFQDFGSQSAPVSPTDNVSRRPSFSSRIIKKTFGMKSLFATTFDRYRKDNVEREQTALTIWRTSFEQSLMEEPNNMPATPYSSLPPTLAPSSASLSTLSSLWAPASSISINDNDNPLSPTLKQTSKSSKYARFIMMELLSTEENYMEDLYIIKSKFMDPLLYASQQPRPIINNRDIRTIFAFIPQLLLLSATLVQQLKTAIKNTMSTGLDDTIVGTDMDTEMPCDIVGRVLCDLETSFDIYVYYAVNFRKSRKCLDKIDCNSLCYQLLQESPIRRKETKRMDLYNFLIAPIQRITRYCLILKDLQKHSPKNPLLDRSVKSMTSLAFAMNEIQ